MSLNTESVLYFRGRPLRGVLLYTHTSCLDKVLLARISTCHLLVEEAIHPEAIAEEPARSGSAQELDTFEEFEARPRAKSYSGEKPSHKRVISDITDDVIQYMRMEEGQGGSPTLSVPSPTGEGPYPSFEERYEDEERSEPTEEVFEGEEDKAFPIPAIDVEVNLTITVDSGLIILRTEERCVLPHLNCLQKC